MLYNNFPEQSMISLKEVMQKEYDKAAKSHIYMNPFDNFDNCKVQNHCHYIGLY